VNLHGFRPKDVLEVVDRKLTRANEHLEVLDTLIANFLEGNPYGFIGKFEVGQTEYVYRFVINAQPPLDILIPLGEALYQMRSSLDHLALGMNAKGNGRFLTTMEYESQFPIRKSRNAFQDRSPQKAIRWMTPDAKRAVKGLQPFNGRHMPGHELWVLDKLFNIDKHRHLTVTGVALAWWGLPAQRVGYEWIPAQRRAMKTGAEIGRFVFDNPVKEVDVNPEFGFGVAFQKTGPARAAPVVPELRQILRFVQNTVIPTLRPFV
jgi:hypothetical protein